ncbi:hypothetical protein [Risungbinella massiliensis]|nr:hypothetical protein [Risungbinella massiliensis]
MSDPKKEPNQDQEELDKKLEETEAGSSRLPLVKGDEDLFFGRIW